MTFLELFQRTASLSGTAGTTPPATTASQTGELGKIVAMVAQAWIDIQTSRRDWRWMEATFAGSITDGVASYTAADLGIASRFGSWIFSTEETMAPFTIFDPAVGETDEGFLMFRPWREFQSSYQVGSFTETRPSVYSVGPDRKVYFGPTPDRTYTVGGNYRKSAQTLALDSDEPECPSDFHYAIVYKALQLLSEDEESDFQLATKTRQFLTWYGRLVADQAPQPYLGSPLVG